MDQKSSDMARLTKAQANEVCRLGGIPPVRHARFVQAVERCVALYLRVRNQKSASEVEAELKQLKKQVQRCLNLLDHKKRRPGEFRKGLKAVSDTLARLSPRARDFLQFRNVRIVHVIPDPWPPQVCSEIVVDPICFHILDDQLAALFELRGALAGPVAMREQGRACKNAERALYHCLAVAYTRDTRKMASDNAPKFIDVCDKIKHIYKLKDWRPGSNARTARRLRKQNNSVE
jgi:hypothetical protein